MYVNVELNKRDAKLLSILLKSNHWRHETSQAGELIHFEILAYSDNGEKLTKRLEIIQAFLDTL